LCFADQRRGEEVGSVLLELTVAEQRFNAVVEVLRDGLTVVEVADRYGVSRQTVHGWLRRYRTGGLEALADRSHRPRDCPHQMPATVEARLCELRRCHPGWGQRRLAHELARAGIDPPPGLTSIYRALVRNGLIQPKARRRAKASYRRWERARPMELWQLDVMGGIWLADGRELKAVTGIDDHSRFCVMAGLVERANTSPLRSRPSGSTCSRSGSSTRRCRPRCSATSWTHAASNSAPPCRSVAWSARPTSPPWPST
jgi:transposase